MDGPLVGVYGIIIMFLVLFLFRIPAGFTMALVGFLGVAYVVSFKAALGMIGTEMWNIFSNYGLTVIPMFILVGEFVHYAGYNDGLYHATYRWFGHYKGGLAITTIMACAAFSAISGSNTATAATMSQVAIPAMKRYKYHPVLNAGSVVAGSTLGVMIPPSIVLVVYGLYTGQSIGKLFFGNIMPSVILTVLIAATVFFICFRHPDWGPQGREKHLEGALAGPAGSRGHPDPLRHHHVRPVHRGGDSHRGGGSQLHPGTGHLPGPAETFLGQIPPLGGGYPAHLLSGLYDRSGGHHLRALPGRHSPAF